MSKRVVIGEGERAGWPISAEVIHQGSSLPSAPDVRWRQMDGYFILEWFNHRTGAWQEVPCIAPE
jgi:hypothetical protein